MSWDTFLGGAFNIANAAMLLHLMALHTGYKPGMLVINSGCTHIYSNHFDQVREQLGRIPTNAPKLEIIKRDSLFDQKIEDFTLIGYQHQGKIAAEVAV